MENCLLRPAEVYLWCSVMTCTVAVPLAYGLSSLSSLSFLSFLCLCLCLSIWAREVRSINQWICAWFCNRLHDKAHTFCNHPGNPMLCTNHTRIASQTSSVNCFRQHGLLQKGRPFAILLQRRVWTNRLKDFDQALSPIWLWSLWSPCLGTPCCQNFEADEIWGRGIDWLDNRAGSPVFHWSMGPWALMALRSKSQQMQKSASSSDS